ncbi:MAG: DinB family protein [candidate division Zixibacteria bacterium]|nr:DinB family protein [candidate division Zixibacteria bacterium]
MPKVDNLLYLLKTTHGATMKTLDGISEADSLVTIPGNPNHIRWITGHLAASAVHQARALGVTAAIPSEWSAPFGRGVEPVADNSLYPSMEALRLKLGELHEVIQSGTEGKSDAELDVEIEVIPGWKATVMNFANFFCIHEFYHAGQVAMIRHTLGKTRLFG